MTVVAFVGENANGILAWWTKEILKGFETKGLQTRLVDMLGADWVEKLATIINSEKIDFAFSLQGIGGDIANKGKNLWTTLGVPFLTYLGDNPYHCPRLHWQTAPSAYLLYSCRDFFETYTDFVKGPATAVLHPYGFPANPEATKTRWENREIDIAYVKTGVDPAYFTSRWATYPRIYRTIVNDAAAIALAGSPETIANIVVGRFAAENVTWGGRPALLFMLASDVDFYVRAVRAARMVRFLMTLPAQIIGSGWDFLDRSESKANFNDNVAAAVLPSLYAHTKIIVSTSPAVRHGIHDRVLAGLMSRSLVLSDTNPYMTETLADFPAFLGADIDDATFEDQARAKLDRTDDIEDRLEVSYIRALEKFSLDKFIDPLLDLLPSDSIETRLADFRMI